ncbi:MAG: CatB-related O-acetyltransferase [Alistipes sp.]
MIKKLLKTIYCELKRIQLRKNTIWIAHRARFNRHTIFEGYNKVHNFACVSGSCVGKYSYIGEHSYLPNCKIGRYCSIASDVMVVTETHPSYNFVSTHPAFFSLGKQCGMTYVNRQSFDEHLSIDNKSIIIENDVWIGCKVTIRGGVRIGNGAIVGMGAVVTKDVLPYSIVGGVPAKIIKFRFTEEQIKWLQAFEWWNKSDEWIKTNSSKFTSIDSFIVK